MSRTGKPIETESRNVVSRSSESSEWLWMGVGVPIGGQMVYNQSGEKDGTLSIY